LKACARLPFRHPERGDDVTKRRRFFFAAPSRSDDSMLAPEFPQADNSRQQACLFAWAHVSEYVTASESGEVP